MIKVKIIADSVNDFNSRLTTFILTYPRYIHSEFMTHRVFSRNASSSRAIPFQKMLKMVEENPAMPVKWGAEQKGMQSGDELDKSTIKYQEENWIQAMHEAIHHAKQAHALNLHKSICNRLLEPFMHITVVATATEYTNFFKLRCHPDAEPTFQALAFEMAIQYKESLPNFLHWGEWHIPFGDRIDENISEEDKLKIATARCARTSYLTFEGEINVEKDIELHDRLSTSGHWSPFEHCARADERVFSSGNFREGWEQYRKSFKGEDGKS